MNFTKGTREKLSKYINTNQDFQIEMSIAGESTYDFCCFGMDANGKFSDDKYMIFYNQPHSPNQEIRYEAGNLSAKFILNLSKLPAPIQKLVFTASIDGNGTMGNIAKHSFVLSQNGEQKISLTLSGSDFNQEKAIISMEIYRKDEWRISAVANGFNGGLFALLAHYGGVEISNTPSTPTSPVIPPSTAEPLEENFEDADYKKIFKKIKSQIKWLDELKKDGKITYSYESKKDPDGKSGVVLRITNNEMNEHYRIVFFIKNNTIKYSYRIFNMESVQYNRNCIKDILGLYDE